MSHRISEECIVCGVCVVECPEQAISDTPELHSIDPEKCNDCGSCAEICPVGACLPE